MPLIKPRTRGKQIVRHITRLDRENNETLYAYAHFLGEPTEYVLNQVDRHRPRQGQGLPRVARRASGSRSCRDRTSRTDAARDPTSTAHRHRRRQAAARRSRHWRQPRQIARR